MIKVNKIISLDNVFEGIKSYSPEEVLDAGGTTAFAIKHGKTMDKLIEALEKLPPIEPFSDEEWNDLMDELSRDK